MNNKDQCNHAIKYKTLIISHIGVHTVYFDTRDLYTNTKLQIKDKDRFDQLKVII